MYKFAFIGWLVLAITLSSFNSPATDSETGIEFADMTLEEAKALAKKEKKLIFIDVYTTWCGPCKMMARTSFKDEAVGETYNAQFINLKLDAEKSEDGKMVARTYRVNAYPTLLFIDAKGKLVRTFIGFRSQSDLLNIASILK